MLFNLLLVLLILDSFVLVAVVLMQAGQGGGLAALGGGSSDSFFGGRQAVTVLTKASWWCGGIFLAISLILAGLSSGSTQPRSVLEGQIAPPTPIAPVPLETGTPADAGEAAAPQTQPQQ